MDFKNIKTNDKEYIANTYARFDLGIAEGHGVNCTSHEGVKYLDLTSGIGVNSLGFCDNDWANAVAKQASVLNHTSNLFFTTPMLELAKKLSDKTGCKKVFFANSGAEANEGAIKTARKYSQEKYGEYKTDILTLVDSFHGRTITTLAATGQDVFHKHFLPLTDGFSYAKANDFDDVLNNVTDKTCAIMLEVVQGEGGINCLTQEFVEQIKNLCEQKDIILIVDEVQTGVGRTGTFLASEQYNLTPDITTLAKGLGGGLPIGAVLFGEKCEHTLEYGQHGSTYGGNPIVCAGANVVVDKITPELLKEIKEKSDFVFSEVSKVEGVKSVTGLGLMIGVEFNDFTGKQVVDKCMEKGVLFLTAKNKLRMLPPLIITKEELETAIETIKQALTELKKGNN